MQGDESIRFIPLGGTGEIGMNMNLYGYRDRWLLIDCGMMIASSVPGEEEILVPDPRYIRERKKKLDGLILTHAHEDHIGAVTDIWQELRCPIFATPFTAAVMRRKFRDAELRGMIDLRVITPGSRIQIGPFSIEFIPITHSTVESQSIAIRTEAGNILHTGDWKFDPDPLVGDLTSVEAFRALGEEGVLAVVGDSTNANKRGRSGSEADVYESVLEKVRAHSGRVACACFSSNIARISTFLDVAERCGRHPVLLGRSLERMVSAAQEVGYLPREVGFVSAHESMNLPPERLLFICTGSQGEDRAALSRIATKTHPAVNLEAGDLAIFSSKIIPGNEVEIERLQQALRRQGVEIISELDAEVHVSGHPCRDELQQMYAWLKPQVLIPVHGYPEHLRAHAEWGECLGIEEVIEIRNGDQLLLHQDREVEHLERVPVGRRERRLLPWEKRLRERERQRGQRSARRRPKGDIRGLGEGQRRRSSRARPQR